MRRRDSELLSQLIQMAVGYWRSQVLFSANELGIFNILSNGKKTSEELAGLCKSSADYTDRLLNACAALGLVHKANGRFQNVQLTETFLVESKPQYMGNWIRLMSTWYSPWGRLAEAIRTGEPVEDPLEHLGRRSEYMCHFVMAMHEYGMGPGKEMCEQLDLMGKRSLLDVGGGAGTYSILLAQKYPQLQPVVFDLPPVVDLAKEVISTFGLSDRIAVRKGDYLVDDLGSGYDVVILSNVLHQEDPESCKLVLQKAYDALVNEGLLVVKGSFLNASKDGPVWPTLQSLMLALVYQGGRTYSLEESLAMLNETGFSEPEVKKISLLNPESLIVARKN